MVHTPAEPGLPLQLYFSLENLGSVPAVVPVSADPAVLKALAEYLEVLAVEDLQGTLSVRRWRKHGAMVEGVVTARIVQECVVTLEPVPLPVREEIRVRFLPVSKRRPAEDTADEIIIDPLADDPPEPFDGRTLDLGALVLEHLALGIDPYPRATGAAVPEQFTSASPEPEARPNPFQILARLRGKPDS